MAAWMGYPISCRYSCAPETQHLANTSLTAADSLATLLRSYVDPDPEELKRLALACSRPEDQSSVILVAAEYGQADALEHLIGRGFSARDREGLALILACKGRGDLRTVQLLMRHGVDPRLHEDEALVAACSAGRTELVELLLEGGCSPLSNGAAPLTEALLGGHPDVFRLMVQHVSADLIRDFATPLARAACSCRLGEDSAVNCVNALLEHIAIDSFDGEPMLYSIRNRRTVLLQHLLAMGGDPIRFDCAALVLAFEVGPADEFDIVTAHAIANGQVDENLLSQLQDRDHTLLVHLIRLRATELGRSIPDAGAENH